MTFDETRYPDNDPLVIGTDEGELTVKIRRGERCTAPLLLEVLADPDDPESGTPEAWPAAPQLVFPGFTVTAVLTASEAPDPVVANAVATWEITPEQTATVDLNADVRIRVDNETWWSGGVLCRS